MLALASSIARVGSLLDTWRTEAQTGSRAFAEKCIAQGSEHPAGMCFQDLGWAARPAAQGDYLRYVTWREYMQSVAGKTLRRESCDSRGEDRFDGGHLG